MEKVYEEIPRIKVQFKSISDLSEVIELQSSKELFTAEEAREFSRKILEICTPMPEVGRYEVEVIFPIEISATGTERPR